MKIAVISDTHIPINDSELPSKLLEAIKGCDIILHGGDLIDIKVLETLKKIAVVEAVYGNMDPSNVKSVLQDKKILDISGKKICLMHGYGHPDKLTGLLKNEFSSEKPDIIVFGHSHTPMNEYIDGILFFNPGSPTDKIYSPYRSYGIIEINGDKIDAKICKLQEKSP